MIRGPVFYLYSRKNIFIANIIYSKKSKSYNL